MEKSAQTSLDSQEESAGLLPGGKLNQCLECSMSESLEINLESSEANCKIMAQCEEEINNFCSCKAGCQFPAYEDNPVSSGQLEKVCVCVCCYLIKGFDQTLIQEQPYQALEDGVKYWEMNLTVLKFITLTILHKDLK